MNKLTTAALGLSLMIGSAFAAAPKPQDSTATTPTMASKTTKTKKHVKKAKKSASATTEAAPASK